MTPIICRGFTRPSVPCTRTFDPRTGVRDGSMAAGEATVDRVVAKGTGELGRTGSNSKDAAFFAAGQTLGVYHQMVQRRVQRALAYGSIASLDDRARPGKDPTITTEAKAGWCRWPAASPRTELSARIVDDTTYGRPLQEHRPAEGHTCLRKRSQGHGE